MSVLRAVWPPGASLLATLFWIWLDHRMGWKGPQLIWLGIFLISLGLLLTGWCVLLFLVRGHGSPHPFVAKTKHLVIAGPYRLVRNPMLWGIAAILVGLCLLLGAATLWVGFVGFLVFIYWFVPRYEERDMECRFGDEYRAYCRQVPRWFPRLRRRPATYSASAGGRK